MSLFTKIIDRQKLKEAWNKVKCNKPAAGVDEVTYDDFDADLPSNLVQLYSELSSHSYSSLPVKIVFLYRGDKRRSVSLYSMRDKVVQQSIASELVKLCDKSLSPSVYAYRPGRSALQAIDYLTKKAADPNVQWILKTDIKDFFDTVVLKKLYAALAAIVHEDDVMELVRECCEAKELKKDGTLTPKTLGIYQGSGIAPVLSNIYLMGFDSAVDEKGLVYVRYADDMIVLGKTAGELKEMQGLMSIRLEALGLRLNCDKTFIKSIDEGVDFLGYHLSRSGREITAKAEESLRQKLEKLWLGGDKLHDKLQKGAEILNGWEQYFGGSRSIGSIEEFAVVAYMVRYNKDGKLLDDLKPCRKLLENVYPDICRYLTKLWEDDKDMVLLEYEQLFGLYDADHDITINDPGAFCNLYQSLMDQETPDIWTELMQLYSDAGAYNRASLAMERIKQLEEAKVPIFSSETSLNHNAANEQDIVPAGISDSFIQEYLRFFAGREDTYGREELGTGKKRRVEQAAEPLTPDVIRDHLSGRYTVSTYIQRSNSTVHYLVIDIDISKKCLLQEGTDAAVKKHLPETLKTAEEMLKLLKRLGLKGYPEYSGFRGYHIWVFFTEWIPTRYANMLTDVIDKLLEGKCPDITIEYFPNKSRLKAGSPGHSVKLPYGIHILSGKRSAMLDESFSEVPADISLFKNITASSLQAVKRIIGSQTDEEQICGASKEADRDLTGFGDIPESIRIVLEHCSLMRYLCQKARKTGYLCHFERLSVLYVFGHLGEEGKQFVHTVMEFTLNYKFHVTDKFISRLPAKPVSCLKLREQYKQITAEYGCSCNFKRTKNCYPSPVLLAIKSSGDVPTDVTIPTSRTISRGKEQQVLDELNIHKKAEELAVRIIDLKKQRRSLDKNISKAEKELERIFDQAGIDALEISQGLMVRRRTSDSYEWVIEL